MSHSHDISKQLKMQKIRMGVLYALLTGLGTWQWHFIWEGVNHNVYLNGMIFGTFFFGSFLAIRSILSLKKEQIALEALQHTYSDIQTSKVTKETDPFARYYRCLEKGIVVERPTLLGHVYDLVLEELLRTKNVRISVSTMQNLTSAIEHTMAQERSLLQYMSGLLVFLGLIGTFIGLMEMVASVGGIIGGLAGADSSGGDAMKKLLHDLEAPLVGMATGFSASLFGLFTSLVLGLVNRFLSSAAHAVKSEFEAWLAGVAQIENGRSGGAGGGAGSGSGSGEAGEDPTFNAAPGVAAIISAMRSTNHTFEKTADAVLMLADRRKEENDVLMATASQIERLSNEQDGMRRAITAMGGIRDDIHSLRELDYAQANRMVDGFAKLESAIEESRSASMKGFDEQTLGRTEIIKANQAEASAINRRIEEMSNQHRTSHLDSVDRLESLAQLQASLTRLTQTTSSATVTKVDDLANNLDRIHSLHSDQNNVLAHLRSDLSAGVRELSLRADPVPHVQQMAVSIDSTLVRGLGEVANVLNTALGVMTSSMKQIAERQQETNQVMHAMGETKELANEIRSLSRSIDGGLSNGFAEMSRSFEAIFMSYSELIRRNAGNTGDVQSPLQSSVPVTYAEPGKSTTPPVSPEALLEERVNKVDQLEKFYSSAQSRLSDLLKSA